MRRQVARLVWSNRAGVGHGCGGPGTGRAGRRATPESDADAAIDQAWTAAGGDASPLGARDGGVYAAGTGFGQNFAGGAIFFSPATGAKIMFGVILDKYRALGGPADSDLGFPNIDEGPGKVSRPAATPRSAPPTTRSSSGPRTPAPGWCAARSTRRGTNSAARRVSLGVPVADETYDGDVVSQKFTGGQLPSTVGPIVHHRTARPCRPTRRLEHSRSMRRRPSTPPGARPAGRRARWAPGRVTSSPIGDDGVGQDFAGGQIFYSPATGAHVVTGAILEKYESAGGPTGDLGSSQRSRGRRRRTRTAGSVPSRRRTIRSSSGRPTTAR